MNLNLVCRRVLREKLSVISQLRDAAALDVTESVRERHLPVPMVVTVGLSVGRDMDELWPASLIRNRLKQASSESFPTLQQSLKRDRL